MIMPMSFPRAGHPARARRLGAVTGGLTALAALAALGSLSWLVLLLQRDVEAGSFSVIDAGRARLDVGAGWFDPRWEQDLAGILAPLGSIRSDDKAAIRDLAGRVRSLPFVADAATPEVLWPDGLRIDVDLRSPVACVRTVDESYLPVSVDGTVLSGAWRAPPARAAGFLPRIVLGREASADVRPGSVLDSRAARDALAIAATLWEHLEPVDLERLGRLTIDARKARQASVEEPGARIQLEHARRILFGRAPSSREPGELPVHLKWGLVSKAVAMLPEHFVPGASGEMLDWVELDVRWDNGALVPRER
jgi:hypothetical protein